MCFSIFLPFQGLDLDLNNLEHNAQSELFVLCIMIQAWWLGMNTCFESVFRAQFTRGTGPTRQSAKNFMIG